MSDQAVGGRGWLGILGAREREGGEEEVKGREENDRDGGRE